MVNFKREVDRREPGGMAFRLAPSISSESMRLPVAAVICALVLVLMTASVQGGVRDTAGHCKDLTIVDFSLSGDVEAGEPFRRWTDVRGWSSPMGNPVYFHIADGRLHLVSKPGPVYDSRHLMAVFQRDKLVDSIENKVLLRLTGKDFRVDPNRYDRLCFTMAPVTLPADGADLRDSQKNDGAFYLIVSFDTERYDIGGYAIPQSVGYVWANSQWRQSLGQDPEYQAFLRYIAIGWGSSSRRGLQRICRKVGEDFLEAYPQNDSGPDIIELFLMIDSNTLGGTTESVVGRIWFECEGQGH